MDGAVRKRFEEGLENCASRIADLSQAVTELAGEVRELTSLLDGQTVLPQGGDLRAMLETHHAEIMELLNADENDLAASATAEYPFRLDPIEREIRTGRRRVLLTPQEYKIIELLWEQMPSTVSREAILERLYGAQRGKSDRVVDVFISKIRQKLQSAGAGDVTIRARHGQGWQLDLRLAHTPSVPERAKT